MLSGEKINPDTLYEICVEEAKEKKDLEKEIEHLRNENDAWRESYNAQKQHIEKIIEEGIALAEERDEARQQSAHYVTLYTQAKEKLHEDHQHRNQIDDYVSQQQHTLIELEKNNAGLKDSIHIERQSSAVLTSMVNTLLQRVDKQDKVSQEMMADIEQFGDVISRFITGTNKVIEDVTPGIDELQTMQLKVSYAKNLMEIASFMSKVFA